MGQLGVAPPGRSKRNSRPSPAATIDMSKRSLVPCWPHCSFICALVTLRSPVPQSSASSFGGSVVAEKPNCREIQTRSLCDGNPPAGLHSRHCTSPTIATAAVRAILVKSAEPRATRTIERSPEYSPTFGVSHEGGREGARRPSHLHAPPPAERRRRRICCRAGAECRCWVTDDQKGGADQRCKHGHSPERDPQRRCLGDSANDRRPRDEPQVRHSVIAVLVKPD
jgi:hypothetical protein